MKRLLAASPPRSFLCPICARVTLVVAGKLCCVYCAALATVKAGNG